MPFSPGHLPALSVEAFLRKLATQRARSDPGVQQCARHLTGVCASQLNWPSQPHFANIKVQL